MSCVGNALPCVTMGPLDLMPPWLCIHMAFCVGEFSMMQVRRFHVLAMTSMDLAWGMRA